MKSPMCLSAMSTVEFNDVEADLCTQCYGLFSTT
ncbi:MAG: Zn-finger nucleic acid-binding protein [Candidatus Azotimanducaceae bacterium]|jgi:Zn-finger nucleic acid-binding protein